MEFLFRHWITPFLFNEYSKFRILFSFCFSLRLSGNTFEDAKSDWQTNTYTLDYYRSRIGGIAFANPK